MLVLLHCEHIHQWRRITSLSPSSVFSTEWRWRSQRGRRVSFFVVCLLLFCWLLHRIHITLSSTSCHEVRVDSSVHCLPSYFTCWSLVTFVMWRMIEGMKGFTQNLLVGDKVSGDSQFIPNHRLAWIFGTFTSSFPFTNLYEDEFGLYKSVCTTSSLVWSSRVREGKFVHSYVLGQRRRLEKSNLFTAFDVFSFLSVIRCLSDWQM